MEITVKRRTILKRIVASGKLSSALWITPIVAVVQLPIHAAVTAGPPPPPPSPSDFEQRVLTCSKETGSIYYEVNVCSYFHPIEIVGFVSKGFYQKDTGPHITLIEPSLPLSLEVGKCSVFKFRASSPVLEFQCSDYPLVMARYDGSSYRPPKITFTLLELSYNLNGAATSTPFRV